MSEPSPAAPKPQGGIGYVRLRNRLPGAEQLEATLNTSQRVRGRNPGVAQPGAPGSGLTGAAWGCR